jgi:RNA polymerase sigma-70 factor, ECF subfamily
MEGTGEEALAAGFAAHESWAFGEAYRRYASLLYSAAFNVLHNADDAKDCVADAMARLWRAARPYAASRGSLRSFLVVCVRNEAISRRRRLARQAGVEERAAALAIEREEPPGDDPIERDRVRRALLALPRDQRIALALAYYEGKTQSEIAAQLQEPLGTIKSRMKLGLRKLATILQSLSPRGDDA